MRKSFTYSFLAAMLLAPATMSADNVKMLTFTVPEEAIGQEKSFQISATDGQSVQVDWGDGTLSDPVALADYDAAGWVFTTVSGKITGTTITVWGADPATINYIDLSYNSAESELTKLTATNLNKLTGVKDIAVGSNNLTKLNLAKNAAVATVSAANNQLEELTLPEGGADSKLTSLTVNNTLSADGTLIGNNQLLATDFSAAPNLKTLNVSYNSTDNLGWFDTFSIEANSEITTLNITGCGLDESYFDFTKHPKLKTLNANFNSFTTADLTPLANKAYVYMTDNKLTSIKVNNKIGRLQIKNNYFTFTTLPVVTLTGTNFVYAPQQDIPVAYGKGGVVNLSSQLTAADKTTTYTWKEGETTLAEGTAYTADNGVFTFSAPLNKAVCEMTNEAFPSLTLLSTPVSSPENLNAVATFTVTYDAANELPVHIEVFSLLEEGSTVSVGAGDGSVTAPQVAPNGGWDGALFDVIPAGETITLYGDDDLSQLAVSCNSDRYPVDAVNVSKLTKLERLTLSNNNITTIDLSANKALQMLSMPSNKLGALNLDLPELTSLTLNNYATSGDNHLQGSDFSKCVLLSTINLNYTGLTEIDLAAMPALRSAYLMGNELTAVTLPQNETFNYLSVNSNKLTALDASACVPGISIYANDNNLEEIKVPAEYTGSLSVKNNKLTFATIPMTTGYTFDYAPQQDMEVTPSDGKVDLSAQFKVGDATTEYKWTAAGTELAEGTDFTAEDGVFTFLNSYNDVVCSMTNSTLPDLTLSTLPMTIVTSEVEGLEAAAAAEVSAIAGAIVITGDFTAATITDMAGRTIAAKAVTPVEGGIYVVVVDGKAHKVAVK